MMHLPDQSLVWAKTGEGVRKAKRDTGKREREDNGLDFMADYTKKPRLEVGVLKIQTISLLEMRNGDTTKEANTKDSLDELHDSESSKNDSETDESIGYLITSSFNILLIAFRHNPAETT